MTSQATVSIGWVRNVIDEARIQGLETKGLLAAAGISQGELARNRWPIDDITRLWRAAVRLTQDTGFGLKVGAHIAPASLSLVGFMLQSATTLRKALPGVRKYQSLISDGGRLQLLAGPKSSWLICHPLQGDLPFSAHQIEAALSAMLTVVRWVHPDLQPLQLVSFSHQRQGPLAGYREIFQCPIQFQQAYSGFLIDNDVLDAPLPHGDARLAHIHEQLAKLKLESMQPDQAMDQALQIWLRAQIGHPLPTRLEAAKAFGLTERTLARRLRSLDTSFAELLDRVRRDQALAQLRTTNRSQKEIALDLGFAELSTFHRAFRRWTGSVPGEWRQSEQASMREPESGALVRGVGKRSSR